MSGPSMPTLRTSVLLLLSCALPLLTVIWVRRPQNVLSFAGWVFIYSTIIAVSYLKITEGVPLDSREPPVVRGTIPYFGHLIGILTRGSRYFKHLGLKQAGPIFTLPMPGSRLYVVTDPSLAASVQRASKVLSFNPLVPQIIQRVAGFDDATIRLMKGDMETGYIQQVQDAVHTRLGQGQYLDQVTLDACNEFLRRLDCFGNELQGATKTVELLHWTKDLVTIATATFFYGPNNPVERDPRLVGHFWDFDAGIPGLLLGVLPALTARKAYRGREAVVKALADYLDSPAYSEAAEITRERSTIGRKFGVDTTNVARSDLTFFFAGIINTSLTSFWMIINIFARPQLLDDIRAELADIVDPAADHATQLSLSIKDIVKACPLLYGVFKEVLRLYSDNFATRVVLSDTLLADKYFLRQGSIVQVSGGIIHADERIWGADVAVFRPERHLSNAAKSSTDAAPAGQQPKQIHAAAFRAFGGGATLCPGRHFALNEIMTLVAMLVLLFDIDGQGGEGIHVPLKKDNVLPIHVLEPVEPICLRVRKREEWAEKTLRLSV